MPVAGGPFIQKTGILLEVDAADKTSYSGTGTTWINQIRPGTFNGTLNNVSFNSSDANGALVFTGSNTFVDFGNLGSSVTSSFSFQVAFKPAPTASGQPYTILSYASASATSSYTFKLDYTSSNQTVVLTTFSNTGSQNIVYALSASVASGSWNIVHGTYGSSLAALYVNGLGQAYVETTGSVVGYNASNRLYAGASFGLTSSFYTGSMGNIIVNNADLDGLTVNKNYNALASRFNLPVRRPTVTDADAFAFVETVGLNETQAAAINTLVLGLKSNNLWTKMVAIYPFIGGTATAHKYNLKNINLYPVIWNGAVTHNSSGSFSTTGGYGNTQIVARDTLTNISSSAHISAYSPGDGGSISYVNGFMGDRDVSNSSTGITISIQYANTKQVRAGAFGAVTDNNYLGDIGRGFFAVTRNSATNVSSYAINPTDGVDVASSTVAFTSATSVPIWLLRDPSRTSSDIMSFATIGDGLTTEEMTALYTLVQAYQTTLGRQV
jgi:hypothetical protein